MSGTGWDVDAGLRYLESRMDPGIWEQGRELSRRDAVEDFAVRDDGSVLVRVMDPREGRPFPVTVVRGRNGEVQARCACPLRVGGFCRHQVVALEYLRAVSHGNGETHASSAGSNGGSATAPAHERPLLYRLFDSATPVSTCTDGSLLRLVLRSLGSSLRRHEVELQLFTGSGWSELRGADAERWIRRGAAGPHARDAALCALLLSADGTRRQIDSETLCRALQLVAGSDAVVLRTGHPLRVSPFPWTLGARVVHGPSERSLAVELFCRSADGESRALEDVVVVPGAAPWIQLADGSFHPLLAGVAGPELERLQDEGELEFTGVEIDRLLTAGVELLERLCRGPVDIEPGLIREVEGVDGARLRLDGTPTSLCGVLELSYGGSWVDAPDTPEPWTVQRDGEILRFPPAGQSIARAERELRALGFRRAETQWALEGNDALARVLASREGAFVAIEVPNTLRERCLVGAAPHLELRVRLREDDEPLRQPAGALAGTPFGRLFFDIAFRATASGRELPLDLDDLRAGGRPTPGTLIQLADGTVLDPREGALGTLSRLADGCSTGGSTARGSGAVTVALPAAMELLEPVEGRDVIFEGRAREMAESLLRAEEIPMPALLDRLDRFLRPYQKEAVRWFAQISRWGFGGILADEMGLGKTIMSLAHLFGYATCDDGDPARGPVLVVCPTTLVFNWLDECARHFPRLRAVALQGKGPEERRRLLRGDVDLAITSYGLLRRDREWLAETPLRAVLLDEAQHIKNPESQTARATFALPAEERWVLTGTPIENHLGELWSLFHFINPGFLGSRREFEQTFGEPIARRESGALEHLRARIRPFVLRRTRSQVLPELPPRIDQVRRVAMSARQRQLYDTYLATARSELGAGDGSDDRFRILAALTRLRQICCHPGLVNGGAGLAGDEGAAGGKFELLMELLHECVDEGHRVLLFSQFTSMLDLIEAELEERHIASCRLDGSTRDREGVVKKFQEDASIPVFLISLKAGGFGLNLTQADTVILYDPWWNPAVEEQAASRAHRLGQTLPVHVHRLVTADSVEERILELQSSKRDLASAVVRSEDEILERLTADDLRHLLLPA